MLNIAFYTALISTIPGLLIRIPLGGAGILLADILLPAIAGFWLILKLTTQARIPSYPLFWPGLLFGLWALWTWLWGAWDLDFKAQIISVLHVVRWFALWVFGWMVFDIAQQFYKSPLRLRGNLEGIDLLKPIWLTLGAILSIGFLQFYFIPDISNYSTVGGFDPHIGRFLGTWMDPNFVAGLLAFTLPVIIGHWYETKPLKNKLWLTILIIMALGAVFLTFSRSGYLAVGAGLGWFFFWKDARILLLGFVLAFGGIISNERALKRVSELSGTIQTIVLQSTDEIDATAIHRVESWTKTLSLWQKKPLQGIGYNTYRYKAEEEGIVDSSFFSAGSADSSLLTILTTTGLIGLFFFALWLWWLAGLSFLKSFKQKSALWLGFSSGVGALVLHSTFVNSLLFPLILIFVLATYGILASAKSEL